jgi:hypothetical protein
MQDGFGCMSKQASSSSRPCYAYCKDLNLTREACLACITDVTQCTDGGVTSAGAQPCCPLARQAVECVSCVNQGSACHSVYGLHGSALIGAIVGGVIGGIVFLALLGVLIYFVKKSTQREIVSALGRNGNQALTHDQLMKLSDSQLEAMEDKLASQQSIA